MGLQSARLIYRGKDHKDIYFQGMYHDKMYWGDILLWEKLGKHPMFSQYFMVNAMQSRYGDRLIDEYGVRLDVNEDAVIEKCAVCLIQSGSKWKRTIACRGSGIIYATYVPYLSYRGEIVYDGFNTSEINTFSLSRYSDGIWNYSSYTLVTANLEAADGTELTVYQIGVAGSNTRIFYDVTEMKKWLMT